MNARFVLGMCGCFVVALGCERIPFRSLDAGISLPDAAMSLVDAGSSPLNIAVQFPLADGGVERILATQSADGLPLVQPTREVWITVNPALQNYRFRVFDEADRAMISDDRASNADGGTEYRILFANPLLTGHSYTVVMDAQSGSNIVDADGRAHPDARIGFKILGDRVKTAPPKRRRR